MSEENVDIGEALYAISRNLIERSSPDLLQKFVGPCQDEDGNDLPDDGIMVTTGGYYRVAEDEQNGNLIILFSFNYDKLRGRADEDGKIRLMDMNGVYPVVFAKKPPFGITRGGALRTEISAHHYALQKGFKEELNLYGADLTGLFNAAADSDTPDPKVMKFGNTMLSYGIYEAEDGKWSLRRRIGEKQTDEKAKEAVLGLDKGGSGKMMDKILSDGESLGAFDTQAEAMAAMILDFNKRGDRRWNAQPMLEPAEIAQAPVTSAKRGVINQVTSFIKNRSMGELLFVGGATLLTLPFSGKFRVGIAALGIAAVYANKFMEQIVVNGVSVLDKMAFWRSESLTTLFKSKSDNGEEPQEKPRTSLDDYIQDEEGNKKRWCAHMTSDVVKDLRLMTSAESDLKPEDAPFSKPPCLEEGPAHENWAKREIPSVQNSAFKAIATPLDARTMSHYYLMGAVAVTHTHTDHSRSVYIMMRPDMKVAEKSFIRPEIEPYIKKGQVMHVHQSLGGEPAIELMDVGGMLEDIKGFLFRASGHPNAHTASAVTHIKWLFGWNLKNKPPADIDHDLADMYAQTAGGGKIIESLIKGSVPQTLPDANPTPDQIAKFMEAKGKAREAFKTKRDLTRAMHHANYPHFKPILKQMELLSG